MRLALGLGLFRRLRLEGFHEGLSRAFMPREHLQMLEMCRDKWDVGGLLAARHIASATPDRVDWTCMTQVLCCPG